MRWLALLGDGRVCHMVRWPGDWRSRSGLRSRPCTNRRPQTWHNGPVSLVSGDLGFTSVVDRRPEPRLRQRSRSHSPASLPASAPGGSSRLAVPPPTSCLQGIRAVGKLGDPGLGCRRPLGTLGVQPCIGVLPEAGWGLTCAVGMCPWVVFATIHLMIRSLP